MNIGMAKNIVCAVCSKLLKLCIVENLVCLSAVVYDLKCTTKNCILKKTVKSV